MLAVDVRDHGDRGRELQERTIALVRLDDDVLPASEARVAAERAEPAADDRSGIQPCAFEQERNHRRRRRLAVGAGDGNADPQTHQLREHLRARNHRDVARARFDDFGILGGNRRGHDDDIRVADVAAVMAGHDADAERRQPIGDVRSTSVGSADLVSEVHEQLSDATHPDATHPDEMHASRAA